MEQNFDNLTSPGGKGKWKKNNDLDDGNTQPSEER